MRLFWGRFSGKAKAACLCCLLALLSACAPGPALARQAGATARPAVSSRAPTLTVPQAATPTPVATFMPASTATLTPTRRPSPAAIRAATQTATRTTTPTATLPASARVKDIYGYGQLYPLSCEARSASDWARHFGIVIHEMEFVSRMPRSENPDEGFAGSLYGEWGGIPPEGYGVHAGPIARLLRAYGARAEAARNMTLDQLRAEIAAGRPVIVWVVGHVEPGKGVPYKVDGQTVTVARFEHTVIATGFDADTITFLDGKKVYQRPVATFSKSWAALHNMAIVWQEEP